MAALNKIGCFALTEPLVGSGASGGLLTTAQRQGDTWILHGQKKWIGNATFADLCVVWARDVSDNQVKAFVVEKGDARLHRGEDRKQNGLARCPERVDHDRQLPCS